MTSANLKTAYDAGLRGFQVVRATSVSYCIEGQVGGKTWKKGGPNGTIVTGAC